MKCTRIMFKSPLHGSVYCEGLTEEHDNRVEFGPYGVLQMYNRGEELLLFTTERCQDLKDCVPDTLKELIVRADFGETLEQDGGLYLVTNIYVNQEPTQEQYSTIVDWVTGQLSDGWGEGLEGDAVFTEDVKFNTTVFDEDTLEFTEEELYYTADYYIHPWVYKQGWYIEEMLRQTVELVVDEEPSELERALGEINQNLALILMKLNKLA